MSCLISIEVAPMRATGTIPGDGRWYNDFGNLQRMIMQSDDIQSIHPKTASTMDLRKKGQTLACNVPWGTICPVSVSSFTKQMQEQEGKSLVYIESDPQPLWVEPEKVR